MNSHERRLLRVEQQIPPATPELDDDQIREVGRVPDHFTAADVDRIFPEPSPDADDLDAEIARIVRAEWDRTHPRHLSRTALTAP